MAKDPKTSIGSPTSDTGRLVMRGRNMLTDVLGKMTFSETFYFIVTGREIPAAQRPVLDAALVILMDHGITPTAMVARLVADSLPDNSQVAIATGALMVGDKFVGTMAGAGALVTEGAKAPDARQWARTIATSAVEQKRRLPGFGHPYYTPTDPRSDRLFEIALGAGCRGTYIGLIRMLGEELDTASGRHLTLNATGALGAILTEVGFPVSAMRGLAFVSRSAGLVAHVMEEREAPITPHLMDVAGQIPYLDPKPSS